MWDCGLNKWSYTRKTNNQYNQAKINCEQQQQPILTGWAPSLLHIFTHSVIMRLSQENQQQFCKIQIQIHRQESVCHLPSWSIWIDLKKLCGAIMAPRETQHWNHSNHFQNKPVNQCCQICIQNIIANRTNTLAFSIWLQQNILQNLQNHKHWDTKDKYCDEQFTSTMFQCICNCNRNDKGFWFHINNALAFQSTVEFTSETFFPQWTNKDMRQISNNSHSIVF